jgi:hypothetical protein
MWSCAVRNRPQCAVITRVIIGPKRGHASRVASP